ncbi:hypothetical protein LTR10_017723 [Elasticomyces elasticus]|uniref:Cupin type-2 domain-containing protein n=1 Tax=Exophiala sideris TaxID=1016849 RepID=A0ABR0JBU7_9EURO|nr:hypothetical protein LTR10_017723 [Elasticomyces elasticus]KAK5031028.1 hypothetical protein LTS07_004763 [Exophiala sideris]KAK5038750.1 hypothetical protein LTR13_003781 [Exophiala sideris]KAK5060633.1 hypothetical protein LTR69_005232 [Exophiala sideris]KAK5183546.1 hypothetical protein LTR44_003828 [Eurotiomycetes sp. CCFEE 6388]
MSSPNSLSPISRFVTGHNKSDGSSVFQTDVDCNPPVRQFPGGMEIFDCYMTKGFPVDVAADDDIRTYEHLVQNPPGIVVDNGSAARVVDLPPAYVSPMHRSLSLNYNFVIEGEVEVLLDSGETRILKRGDGLVQRAVKHAWRNTSETDWARITAVVLPVQGFVESSSEGEEQSS